MFLPRGVGFNNRVEDQQEFSHGGDDDDFEGFSAGGESVGEGFDDRVVAHGVKSGHVEEADKGSKEFLYLTDCGIVRVGRESHDSSTVRRDFISRGVRRIQF